MSVKCKDIAAFIEKIAPPFLAEEWDNPGLMVGDPEGRVQSILLALDVTGKVAAEASGKGIDLIISHHPLIFKGLKNITRSEPKGRIISDLIKAGISVYSAHTNLDFSMVGVNRCLAERLELVNIKNLMKYKADKLYKVAVFVPVDCTDSVREAMAKEGAGWIGNYSDCFFCAKGTGTFKPLDGTRPYIGTTGKLEKVNENKLETAVPGHKLEMVINAMLKAHPYEEVAYDVYELERGGQEYGMGLTGALAKPQELDEFVAWVKDKLDVKNLRLTGSIDRKIKRVAVFCGSFDDQIVSAVRNSADVLVTGDLKYHDAVDMREEGMFIIDAGHFGTEHVVLSKLAELIQKSFPGIAVHASAEEEEPFIYY